MQRAVRLARHFPRSQQLRSFSTMAQQASESGPTKGYALHHTMIRCLDKDKSHHFYSELLGMKQVAKKEFKEGKFTLLFYAYLPESTPVPTTDAERYKLLFDVQGHVLELTWNWEHEPGFKYSSGNEEPGKGFGHLAITVPDVKQCVDRLREAGVKIRKGPEDGKMKGLAFVEDPDGYWIEIVAPKTEINKYNTA